MVASSSPIAAAPVSELTSRFLAAQLAGDPLAALEVIEDGLRCGLAVPEVYIGVVRAAQFEIGRLWQENRVTIAQEHLATGIAQLALANLYPRMPRKSAVGRRVLIACVEGEMHDVGPRICADFLEMAGLQVRFLGANVPVPSLAIMVADWRPDVVVLSMTLPVHVQNLREAVAAVRRVSAAPIVAGGYAFAWDPALADDLPLHATGVDVDQLVGVVRTILGAA